MFKKSNSENLEVTRLTPWQGIYLPFLAALQFLSTLPTGRIPLLSDQDYGKTLNYYPLVGALLGGILYLGSVLFSTLFPINIAAALVLALWVVLTGALHLDGLADSADAWIGGLGSKEKSLRIMKDPTSGPIAICTLTIVLLLKFLTLSALIAFEPWLLIWPLIIARICAPLLLISTPYLRTKGLASALTKYSQPNAIWSAALGISLICAFTFGWQALVILASSAITFFVLRWMMLRKLGGCTGDTVGALIELTELLILLTLVATIAPSV